MKHRIVVLGGLSFMAAAVSGCQRQAKAAHAAAAITTDTCAAALAPGSARSDRDRAIAKTVPAVPRGTADGIERLRDVVEAVTAFTLAHSLTLAAAVPGIVRMPATIVEPVIAASIVYVGIESLVRARIDSRWKLTFACGLVHGVGFAAALRELGIGSTVNEIAVRLASFNAGAEMGQIGVAMLVWPLLCRLNARPALQARLAPACSLLVVGAGAYWSIERTLMTGH